MSDLAALTQAIEVGDRATAVTLTRESIEAGGAPSAILEAMTSAMTEIGRKFQCNEVYVPEMLIAARAMKEAMVLLEPLLASAGIRPVGTAIIGTIQGDLHDIGKNLVSMMWKGANIEVVDLGTNVEPERFVAAVEEHHAQIVGISALLTTTMVGMQEVVSAIRAANLGDVRVLVGGAPVTADFASQIGADGYAPDAASAADLALGFIKSGV